MAWLCVQCPALSNVFYAVDRLEGPMAGLVGGDETTVDLPRRNLPARVREGSVLRVALGADGRPDWSSAKIDDQERERRLKAAQERLHRVRRSGPRGDIKLQAARLEGESRRGFASP